MPNTRVYCVVSDGTNIYLPIKREYYPTQAGMSRRRAYLRQMPNFFGGKVKENGESLEDALCREVNQESQGNIVLSNISSVPASALIDADISDDKYYFCFMEAGEGSVITFTADASVMPLSNEAAKYSHEYREMECIIKIPIAQLRAIAASRTQETTVDDIVNLFLRECERSYGEENVFVNRLEAANASSDPNIKSLYTDWNDSETKKAFVELVKKYAPQSP